MKTDSVAKIGTTNTYMVVDGETGELVEQQTSSHRYISNSKESFILLYNNSFDCLKRISAPSLKAYMYLLNNYNPGTLIGINKGVRNEIQQFFGSRSPGTINNCLTQLCKENLLIKEKLSLGSYYINPRYAFKGSSKNRNKSLQELINKGYLNA